MPIHDTSRPYPLLASMVATSVLVFTSPSFAAVGDPLILLGVESPVLDREIAPQEWLSLAIAGDTVRCEAQAAEKVAGKKDKKKDKAEKAFFKCLDKSLKSYAKADYIDGDEKKQLKALLRDIRKGDVTPPDPGTDPDPILSTIVARVTQPDGAPVVFVAVSLADDGTALGTTSGSGTVSIDSLDADADYVLRFSGAGYADQIVPVSTAGADRLLALDITMIAREEVTLTVVDGTASATGSDGASVSFPVGSFVDSAGAIVDESLINVTMTPVDVSNAAELNAFPGDFVGVDGAVTSTIASLGTVEFDFSIVSRADGSEEPVNLSPTASATIEIPIYFTTRPDTREEVLEGSSIPLWSLNEETGDWIGEGEGIVVASSSSPTGFALQADVAHFSWWNCDVALSVGRVIVSVAGAEAGVATVSGVTEADLGWRSSSVNFAQSVGTSSGELPVPANEEVCYSADIAYVSGASGVTNTVCETVGAETTTTIVLQALDADAALTLGVNATRDAGGAYRIAGFVGAPLERLRVSPASLETAVGYSLLGNLPSGVQLLEIGTASAEIVGVPSVSGIFEIEIVGTNEEGEIDVLRVVYDISSDTPPPMPVLAIIYGDFERNSVELGNLVPDLVFASWELSGAPLPVGMTIDTATGEISVSSDLLFDTAPSFWDWRGVATGTTDGGNTLVLDLTVRVQCGFCGPYDFEAS